MTPVVTLQHLKLLCLRGCPYLVSLSVSRTSLAEAWASSFSSFEWSVDLRSGLCYHVRYVQLLEALMLYLVILSMDFLRPAVIIAFLKVPVCAKAFKILQALTTSTAFRLLAKYNNSGKISSSTNACRPSSDFWAISWHMSNTHLLHSSSVMLCRGLQGSSALKEESTGDQTCLNHLTRSTTMSLMMIVEWGDCLTISSRRQSAFSYTPTTWPSCLKMSRRLGKESLTRRSAWSGAAINRE